MLLLIFFITFTITSNSHPFVYDEQRKPSSRLLGNNLSVDTLIHLLNSKAIRQENTFANVIQLMQSVGENCTRFVTKEVLELQQAVNLNKHLRALNQHLQSTFGHLYGRHAGMFPGQKALYILLSHQPWVKQVCEIGFNAGHSALFWLAGSDKTKLVSFDKASLDYTKPMGEYLKSLYPGRLETVWGDSRSAVPTFWQQKRFVKDSYKCDVVVIDGSHQHDFVLADLRNMRTGVAKQHLIILDDSPCRMCEGVGSAIVDARHELLIEKYADCIAYPDISRGMTFAYYRSN